MVVEQLKQIDLDNNNRFELGEITNELNKPNGFFSNEDNLKKIGNLLNKIDKKEEKNKELKGEEELMKSMEDAFMTMYNEIIQKKEFNEEDKKILGVWKKMLGDRHNDELNRLRELEIRQDDEIFYLENLINDIDTDQDGIITESEFKKYINDENYIEKTISCLDDHFQECEQALQKYKGKELKDGKLGDNLEIYHTLFYNEVLEISKKQELTENEHKILKLYKKTFGNIDLGWLNLGLKYTDESIQQLYNLNKNGLLSEEKQNQIIINIEEQLCEISNNYTKELTEDSSAKFFTNPEDIKLIQLYANIKGDDKIKITGIRGEINNEYENIAENNVMTNEERTNVYIKKEEQKRESQFVKIIDDMSEIVSKIDENKDDQIAINELINYIEGGNSNVSELYSNGCFQLYETIKTKDPRLGTALENLNKQLESSVSNILTHSNISDSEKKILMLQKVIFNKVNLDSLNIGEDYTDNNILQLYNLNKYELLDSNDKNQLMKKIDDWVKTMSTRYNRNIAQNAVSPFCNGSLDIKLIQLHASICLGDPKIEITGKKGNNNINYTFNNIRGELTNEQRTDMYILRQEIETRGEEIRFRDAIKNKKFSDILDIPNIDDMMSEIKDQEAQERVFTNFLNFYCQVKVCGLHFENHIGNKDLQGVLINLIQAEIYKDVSVDVFFDFLDKVDDIKNTEGGDNNGNDGEIVTDISETISEIEYDEKKKEEKTKRDAMRQELKDQKYTTMGEYYSKIAEETKKTLLQKNKEFVGYNKELAFNNTLKERNSLCQQLDGVNKEINLISDDHELKLHYGNNISIDENPVTYNGKTAYKVSVTGDSKQYYVYYSSSEKYKRFVMAPDPIPCERGWYNDEKTEGALKLKTPNYSAEEKNNIKKVSKDLLKNPLLTQEQRDEVLIRLGMTFSETPTYKSYELKPNCYGRQEMCFSIPGVNQIFWTEQCNVKIEKYDPTANIVKKGGPSPTGNNEPIQITIKLDGKILSINGNRVQQRDGYKIELKNGTLTIQKTVEGGELRQELGDDIYNQYQNVKSRINNFQKEYELYGDVLTQVNSADKLSLNNLTQQQKKIVEDYEGYTTRYENYIKECQGMAYAPTQYAQYPQAPKQPIYSNYFGLKIPGCEGKIVHASDPKKSVIQKAIKKYANQICFKPTQSTNGNIYEISLADLKIAQKDEKGNIILYNISNSGEQGEKSLTITTDNIEGITRNSALAYRAVLNTPGIRDVQANVKSVQETLKKINNMTSKYYNKKLTEAYLYDVREDTVELLSQLYKLCGKRAELIEMKTNIESWYHGNNGVNTGSELSMQSVIDNVQFLIDATDTNGSIQKLCNNVFSDKEWKSNNTFLKRVWNWLQDYGIQTVAAIAGGVLAAVLTPVTGGSSLVIYAKLAAVMTAAGMIGGEIGHQANKVIHNLNTTTYTAKNGEVITSKYDAKSTLDLAISGEISWSDFALETGKQFLIGTATTFTCMYVGNLAGQWMSKIIENGGNGSKFVEIIKKLNKNFKVPNGDPATQGMFSRMSAEISGKQSSLITQFSHEFFEEISEELTETGFSEVSNRMKVDNPGLAFVFSGLASLATAWHCLTPGGNMPKMYEEHGITLGNMNYDEKSRELKITLDHNGNENAIIQYYTQNGYKYTNGRLEMKNQELPNMTNVIELNETKSSVETRTLVNNLSVYGVSLENDKGYYASASKLNEIALTGIGIVKIDSKTKQATVILGDQTITLDQRPYFDGKTTKLGISQEMAIANSYHMDLFAQNPKYIDKLKETIELQYKQTKGIELKLTDEQMEAIIQAHNSDGILGNLTKEQLRSRIKILDQADIDPNVRRFLLEAGFCGRFGYSAKGEPAIYQKTKGDIQMIIEGNSSTKISEMTPDEKRLLMWKASNMGFTTQEISRLGNQILANTDITSDVGKKLQDYVSFCCLKSEIMSCTEADIFRLNERIEHSLSGNDVLIKQLEIELSKKKFDFCKDGGRILDAKNEIKRIDRLNKSLISTDHMNFQYKRNVLDLKLLEIQLGSNVKADVSILKKESEEIRNKSSTIGGKFDTETLLAKIEAGIILGKRKGEMQPYMDLLALTEHGVGISQLGVIIEGISNRFSSADVVLTEYSENVIEAGNNSKNKNLQASGQYAKFIAEEYNKIKDSLEKDPNGINKKEITTRLNDTILQGKVESIVSMGVDFSHPTRLVNARATAGSPVPSIEISSVDYEAANTILKEIGFNMDGKWDSYGKMMSEFNEKVDERIRTKFNTEKLQELNSPEHRAFFDYIAANFLSTKRENSYASLTNLSQLIEISGLQDCRLHAFTKELLFDTWRNTQLQSLYNEKIEIQSVGGDETTINKKIQLMENTHMIIMDATFSGKVDMNAQYVARTENGIMQQGKEKADIEEHTFNIIEEPELDAEGNLVFNEDGSIKKVARFADSFYQGNGGTVYNLTYNKNTDISTGIYGKKGGEIKLTTEVTVLGKDGKIYTEVIEVTPLNWSMTRNLDGSGGNAQGSSISSRISQTEINIHNEEYKINEALIQEVNNEKTEIQSKLTGLLEKINRGESVNLGDVQDAVKGIEYKQAQQIQRAFELYYQVGNENAYGALSTMIENITTKKGVEYASQLGGPTAALQTEVTFLSAMKPFNDVLFSELKKATEEYIKNPTDKTKGKYKSALQACQKIYQEDVGTIVSRTNSDIESHAKAKRAEVYDRGNFEIAAERFSLDVKYYEKIVSEFESVGLYNEAFELREQLKNMQEKLLLHGQESLGHLINSSKIKKEMKGPHGREIYNHLLDLRAKIDTKKDIEIDAELESLGIKSDIINMLSLDGNTKIGADLLQKSIELIQDSGLADFYKTIELVYNPVLENMNMEDGVYSCIENDKYVSGTDNIGLNYGKESNEHYILRQENESKFKKDGNFEKESIKTHLLGEKGILGQINEKTLSSNVKSQISNVINSLIDLCTDCGISGEKLYDISKKCTEALVYQTLESQTRSLGDHGVNHVLGNISRFNMLIDAALQNGIINNKQSGEYKLMGTLIHIFHDIGYAATIAKGGGHYAGTDVHPFTSKMFFETNISLLLDGTGIDLGLIGKAMEAHDGIVLNFSSPEAMFLSFTNLSDNLALGLDKISQIFTMPNLVQNINALCLLTKYGVPINTAKQNIIEKIKQDPTLSEYEKSSQISSIDEFGDRMINQIDFWSISPYIDTDITKDGQCSITMYQGSHMEYVAEMYGINASNLEKAISTGNTSAVLEIIKGSKFLGQIIKPLKDYTDIYSMYDSEGNIYGKNNDSKGKIEYDWDVIKTDLLLGKKIILKNGEGKTVLIYEFAKANDLSIDAEENNLYSNEAIEGMKASKSHIDEMNVYETIGSLGEMNEILKQIDEKINKKEDISEQSEKLKSSLHTFLKIAQTSNNTNINNMAVDIGQKIKHVTEISNYSEINTEIKGIMSDIATISGMLVQ